MSDFMISLLDLCFMLFSKTENLIIVVPTACLFVCFSFGIVRRLVRC